ncbi:MAG: transglutaminase family protein [Candidatus Acidiferrum sp.]|jgi:transglutaminase-like putative cysteine protease
MIIRIGYDIQFGVCAEVPIVALLNVHPSREKDLIEPDIVCVEPETPSESFVDSFGNRSVRVLAKAGPIRFHSSTLIRDSGQPDEQGLGAQEISVRDLPHDVLPFLMSSRYCEVDLLLNTATELFGSTPRGWERVGAIVGWVHNNVTFGYKFASRTRTALGVYTERIGVCRDFQHLAITFCRAMNIPARYVMGYLGDIGVPPDVNPMDFSAWFEVYLGGRWWTADARHHLPRIGRVLMATGRDATDCAITTSFGQTTLKKFAVITDEVKAEAAREA